MNKFAIPSIIVLIMLIALIPYFSQDTAFNSDVSVMEPIIPSVNVGVMRLDPVYYEQNNGVEVLSNGKVVKHASKGINAMDATMELAKQLNDSVGNHLGNQVAVVSYRLRDKEGAPDIGGIITPTANGIAYNEMTYWVDIYNKLAFDGTNYSPSNLKQGATTVSSTQYRSVLFTDMAEKLTTISTKPVRNSLWVDDQGNPLAGSKKVSTALSGSKGVESLTNKLATWR